MATFCFSDSKVDFSNSKCECSTREFVCYSSELTYSKYDIALSNGEGEIDRLDGEPLLGNRTPENRVIVLQQLQPPKNAHAMIALA